MYYREITTKLGHKITAKRRSFNCAVLPYILNGWNMKMFPRYSPIIRYLERENQCFFGVCKKMHRRIAVHFLSNNTV